MLTSALKFLVIVLLSIALIVIADKVGWELADMFAQVCDKEFKIEMERLDRKIPRPLRDGLMQWAEEEQ